MESELFDIPGEEIYKRKNLKKIDRKSLLEAELEDFEKLKDITFLKDFKEILTNPYKLEKGNSFNRETDQKFLSVGNSMNELSDFLESQSTFYENRISIIESELKDKYRAKFLSLVLQTKIDSKFWRSFTSDNLINNKLMESSFSLFTEIQNSLSIIKVETINGKTRIPVSNFAFGTETSEKTYISHYQIYLEF